MAEYVVGGRRVNPRRARAHAVDLAAITKPIGGATVLAMGVDDRRPRNSGRSPGGEDLAPGPDHRPPTGGFRTLLRALRSHPEPPSVDAVLASDPALAAHIDRYNAYAQRTGRLTMRRDDLVDLVARTK